MLNGFATLEGYRLLMRMWIIGKKHKQSGANISHYLSLVLNRLFASLCLAFFFFSPFILSTDPREKHVITQTQIHSRAELQIAEE